MSGFFNTSDLHAKTHMPTLPRCGQCGLTKRCLSPRMEPTGNGTRSILFVGEAPGSAEDKKGNQFVGASGTLLRRVLHSIGENLEDATKTNAVICRPSQDKILSVHINSCRPNLIKTIQDVNPTVIVLMGGTPIESLLPLEWGGTFGGAAKWVGWNIPSPTFNAWICPTHHPSHLLQMKKDKILMKVFKRRLKRAYELEKQGRPNPMSLTDWENQVEVITSSSQARSRLRDLLKKKGKLAFDYETTGLKPERKGHKIVSCSFCLNGEDTFAFMMDDRLLRLVSRILLKSNLLKIASNLKFEERWTRFFMGHGVKSWFWDTMLATHVLDNRKGICSVKFQTFLLFGIGDYGGGIGKYLTAKDSNSLNTIDKAPVDKLLLYNGLDSLFEYKVAEKQMELIPKA
jgi:uracil-DNA glycosylase family 4